MHFFLKNIVTLFYKKLRIKIVVFLLRESGPWSSNEKVQHSVIKFISSSKDEHRAKRINKTPVPKGVARRFGGDLNRRSFDRLTAPYTLYCIPLYCIPLYPILNICFWDTQNPILYTTRPWWLNVIFLFFGNDNIVSYKLYSDIF